MIKRHACNAGKNLVLHMIVEDTKQLILEQNHFLAIIVKNHLPQNGIGILMKKRYIVKPQNQLLIKPQSQQITKIQQKIKFQQRMKIQPKIKIQQKIKN